MSGELVAKRTASAYRALRPVLRRFVAGYLAGEKPTQIVRKLRPHLKRPDVRAAKWMARADVRAAIEEQGQLLLQQAGVTPQMIVRELAAVGFGDVRQLFDEKGNLKPVHELDEMAAAQIAGIEVEELVERNGKKRTVIGRLHKIKRWDKIKALSELAALGGLKRNDPPPPAPNVGPGLTVIIQNAVGVEAGQRPSASRVAVQLPRPEQQP